MLRDNPVLIGNDAMAAVVFIDLVRIRADCLRSQLALIVVRVARVDTMMIIEAMVYPSGRHVVDTVRRKLTVFARGIRVGRWQRYDVDRIAAVVLVGAKVV